jgi:hypothetical protein
VKRAPDRTANVDRRIETALCSSPERGMFNPFQKEEHD